MRAMWNCYVNREKKKFSVHVQDSSILRTENFHQHLEITVWTPIKVYDFNTKLYSEVHKEDFIPDLALWVRCMKNPKPTELQLLFKDVHSP